MQPVGPPDNESVIRHLYEISTEYDLGFPHQVQALLQVGLDRFGLEIGVVSRIIRDSFELIHLRAPADFGLRPGAMLPLGETYASMCLEAGAPVGVGDLSGSGRVSPAAFERWGLGAYIGVPVLVDGEMFGTLSFSSRRPRRDPFQQSDLDIMKLMASWLGSELSRKEKDDALRKAEESFRKGIDASPAGMIMVDQQGCVTYANKKALTLFGYEFIDLLGSSIELLVPEVSRPAHPRFRAEYMARSVPRPMGPGSDLQARRSDGEIFPVEVGLNPIDTPYGAFVLCTVLDLTERKRFERRIIEQTERLREINRALEEQAVSDSLTGLANRRGLHAQMEAILRLARRGTHPTSLLMLDVDHFKEYNDTCGHPAGDEALRTVAGVLQDAARRSDIVARYGGEEFVVLLPETGSSGALDVAERIRGLVAAAETLERPLTVSIGAATLEGPDARSGASDLAERLITESDQALYRAKSAGRNRVVHFSAK